jgi:hypothetical protein
MESETAGASLRPQALEAATLCEAFQTTAAERSSQVALRTPDDKGVDHRGAALARVLRGAMELAGEEIVVGSTITSGVRADGSAVSAIETIGMCQLASLEQGPWQRENS